MALFTSPLVLNDGTVSRTYSFRSQQPDKKSVVGDYIEDAAALAAESLIVVKHDSTGSTPRHLLQFSIWLVPASSTDGVRKRITINTSIMADPAFTAAEVEKQHKLSIDAQQETGFVAGMLSAKI